jgi:protein-tyrosine phosphatase
MANQIVPGLFLGDWADGKFNGFNGFRGTHTLCVIETNPLDKYEGMTYYIPILDHSEETYLPDLPPKALISKLDEACTIIDDHLLNNEPLLVHGSERIGNALLVHCWAGIERSPLTLAYWLVKSHKMANLDEAYKFLKSKRPIVEDRREWLPLSLASSL